MGRAILHLEETAEYAQKIKRELTSISGQFQDYFNTLKEINSFIEDLKGRNVDINSEIEKLGERIITTIENGFGLASILVDLITTPLFKLKKINGEVVLNEENVPEMEKDEDGSFIINDLALEAALKKAKGDAKNIESAN